MASRALRVDAAENRERIVAAARAALSESNGAIDELSLHLVAKAAQVGQGTLYRHFPTRQHLLAEVYRQELSELVDAVPNLLVDYPPLTALTRWLERLLDYARVKRGVMAAIEASTWRDLHTGQHDQINEALGTLLDHGRRSGNVRTDVDATDVILLLGALTRIPSSQWDVRAATLTTLIVDGLRTC